MELEDYQFTKQELKYLELLSEKYPTVQSVCTEIINLKAIFKFCQKVFPVHPLHRSACRPKMESKRFCGILLHPRFLLSEYRERYGRATVQLNHKHSG